MSDYWNPVELVAFRDTQEAFRQIDVQMRNVLELIKIRRVQRVSYHFFKKAAGAALGYSSMFIPGLETVTVDGVDEDFLGATAYLIPRGGYVIDITLLTNFNITAAGWYVYLRLNGETDYANSMELSTSRRTQVASTSYYHNTYKFDYGDRTGMFRIEPLTLLEVQYRAINSSTAPTSNNLLVSVNIAHTGED